MAKVKVYTKNNCPQCNMTKTVLQNEGVDFEEINVEEDEKALDYVKNELGFVATPIVVSESIEPFAGFKPDQLQKLAEQ